MPCKIIRPSKLLTPLLPTSRQHPLHRPQTMRPLKRRHLMVLWPAPQAVPQTLIRLCKPQHLLLLLMLSLLQQLGKRWRKQNQWRCRQAPLSQQLRPPVLKQPERKLRLRQAPQLNLLHRAHRYKPLSTQRLRQPTYKQPLPLHQWPLLHLLHPLRHNLHLLRRSRLLQLMRQRT